jgi:hypothetical protein
LFIIRTIIETENFKGGKSVVIIDEGNMNDVRFKLESTYSLVVANDSLFYWKRIVLPRLESLQTLLQDTLDTTLEEDDFDE